MDSKIYELYKKSEHNMTTNVDFVYIGIFDTFEALLTLFTTSSRISII